MAASTTREAATPNTRRAARTPFQNVSLNSDTQKRLLSTPAQRIARGRPKQGTACASPGTGRKINTAQHTGVQTCQETHTTRIQRAYTTHTSGGEAAGRQTGSSGLDGRSRGAGRSTGRIQAEKLCRTAAAASTGLSGPSGALLTGSKISTTLSAGLEAPAPVSTRSAGSKSIARASGAFVAVSKAPGGVRTGSMHGSGSTAVLTRSRNIQEQKKCTVSSRTREVAKNTVKTDENEYSGMYLTAKLGNMQITTPCHSRDVWVPITGSSPESSGSSPSLESPTGNRGLGRRNSMCTGAIEQQNEQEGVYFVYSDQGRSEGPGGCINFGSSGSKISSEICAGTEERSEEGLGNQDGGLGETGKDIFYDAWDVSETLDGSEIPQSLQGLQMGFVRKKPLSCVVAYLDIKTGDKKDASESFKSILKELGASVKEEWDWSVPEGFTGAGKARIGKCNKNEKKGSVFEDISITHVVWRLGSPEILEKVKTANKYLEQMEETRRIYCVGIHWIMKCEEEDRHVDEAKYTINEGSSAFQRSRTDNYSWVISNGEKKRVIEGKTGSELSSNLKNNEQNESTLKTSMAASVEVSMTGLIKELTAVPPKTPVSNDISSIKNAPLTNTKTEIGRAHV